MRGILEHAHLGSGTYDHSGGTTTDRTRQIHEGDSSMPGRRDEITKRWCFDSVQKFWDSKELVLFPDSFVDVGKLPLTLDS